MSELPATLAFEIKTTRRAYFVLDERDLAGVGLDGHIVALITPRRFGGPRWVLVPAAQLRAGRVHAEELVAKAVEPDLARGLQRVWSDWMLDANARRKLAQGGPGGLRERVRWCRLEHPPRAHTSLGSMREVRVDAALRELQEELEHGTVGGSQVEGQLHQILIEDALVALGYQILPNPIGVPDVSARLAPSEAPAATIEHAGLGLHAALSAWEPEADSLRSVRAALLRLDALELQRFGDFARQLFAPK